MTKWRRVRKDHVAALLLIAMGIAILVIGFRYRMGTLVHMGAGFIPVVLGILMTAVGLVIGLLAYAGSAEEKAAQALPAPPDLRGGLCILAAVAVFVLLGAYGGLVPATFGSVFEGPWALLRLFDRVSFEPVANSQTTFRATLDIGGRKAVFEVTASSVRNPFKLPELHDFQCPMGL